jgi:hypothetical protein
VGGALGRGQGLPGTDRHSRNVDVDRFFPVGSDGGSSVGVVGGVTIETRRLAKYSGSSIDVG